jgi:hypothetical protein
MITTPDVSGGPGQAPIVAARSWLTVYRLPPYARELNPVDPVWAHLKRSLAKPDHAQPHRADRAVKDPSQAEAVPQSRP